MAPFHFLKFELDPGPVTLNVLSVDPCDRVHKMQRVVDIRMRADVR